MSCDIKSISLTSTNELSQVGRPAQVESDRSDEPDLELADPLEGLMGTILPSATFEGDSVVYSLQSWSKKITVSAATRLIPRPPARVDKRNSLQASGESPALLNSSICSSRSGCFVVPSIRKVFQFYSRVRTSAMTLCSIPRSETHLKDVGPVFLCR